MPKIPTLPIDDDELAHALFATPYPRPKLLHLADRQWIDVEHRIMTASERAGRHTIICMTDDRTEELLNPDQAPRPATAILTFIPQSHTRRDNRPDTNSLRLIDQAAERNIAVIILTTLPAPAGPADAPFPVRLKCETWLWPTPEGAAANRQPDDADTRSRKAGY